MAQYKVDVFLAERHQIWPLVRAADLQLDLVMNHPFQGKQKAPAVFPVKASCFSLSYL